MQRQIAPSEEMQHQSGLPQMGHSSLLDVRFQKDVSELLIIKHPQKHVSVLLRI